MGRKVWWNSSRLCCKRRLAVFAHGVSGEKILARPKVAPLRFSRWSSPHSPQNDTGGSGPSGLFGWSPQASDGIVLPAAVPTATAANPMVVILRSALTILIPTYRIQK